MNKTTVYYRRRKRRVIFLGAGASKAFGIKTLQEMTPDLEKFMEKKGQIGLISEIGQALMKYQLNVDFEALYTIVQAMADPFKAIRKAGALTAFLCKDLVKPRNFSK